MEEVCEATDAMGSSPRLPPKGLVMPHVRPLAIRLAVAGALVLAALPGGGWKWG
jgi:hypothetical protein